MAEKGLRRGPRAHVFLKAAGGGEVVVDGEDARHLSVVLRLSPGELFTAADGRGRVFLVRATRVSPALVRGEVLEEREVPASLPQIHIYQGLIRRPRLEVAVEKLTELGVARIVMVNCARSVVRLDGERRTRARSHLAGVARAAAKQSRRSTLPEVAGPLELEEALEDLDGVSLFLHEAGGERLSRILPEAVPSRVNLVIGPEGGFEGREIELMQGAGLVGAWLGPGVMRSETAALVAATLVLHAYGVLG